MSHQRVRVRWGIFGRPTTGCTFDSSCRTSLACRVHSLANEPQAQRASLLGENRTHLLAKSLHIGFGQLFTLHEALDPTIKGGDGRWLRGRGWRMGLRDSAHVLHVGIHIGRISHAEVSKVSRDVDVGEAAVCGAIVVLVQVRR